MQPARGSFGESRAPPPIGMLTLFRHHGVIAAFVVGMCGGCRCAGPRSGGHTVSRVVRRALYNRGEAHYREACFFKPSDVGGEGLETVLAPLIVQQVSDPGPGANHRDRFGEVEVDRDGQWIVEPRRPTVYAGKSDAFLNGRAYEQVVCVWLYPPSRSSESPHALYAQGIRMTLNAAGFPIIWEVLGSDTDAVMIYVAESLENAAVQEFGPALPQRRFAIERPVWEQPNVVVAGVLSDGPVPMGPFVYLQAGTRAVSTVICRCMASRVDAFVESVYYDLKPLDRLTELGFGSEAPLGALANVLGGPSGGDPSRLERVLRLPSHF